MLEDHLLPKADQLDRIARESKLIQRSSHKFSATGFLIALLKAVIKGDTSLNQLVMHLAGFAPKTMTRQGMFQRFGPASSRFLLGVIREVLTQRFPAAASILRSGRFRRVIVEDSVVISMAKSNAANLPNNGNRHEMTAGCKCLLMADLLSGKPLDFQLHAAREADQALAFESVGLCRSNDLLIRDMGFFCIDALAEIERRKAFWISRLPASVSAADLDGKKLDKILKGASGDRLDLPVMIGRGTLPCRLVAIRLDRKRAAANRRHIWSEARRRGRGQPENETLARAGWRIIVTNLQPDQVSAEQLSDLYALRWSIEKISDFLSIHLRGFSRHSSTAFPPPDPRHLRYERRNRTNHWQAITHSLA